jgi:hypothetical protein
MAVELMTGYNNNRTETFTTKAEENAVQEAASGLESVEKLIKLLSQARHNQYQPSNPNNNNNNPSMEIERDCNAVADIAVSKFKRVISLLEKTRTGHARFRKAPLPQTQQIQISETPIFNATPLQQIPPSSSTTTNLHRSIIQRKDSSKTLNFSYSSAANSFISSLTGAGDTDNKQPSSSSLAGAFQITNLSHVSSVGKPPLSSSSLKRKCSSETLGSGKCGSSSSRCHCSKKRYVN